MKRLAFLAVVACLCGCALPRTGRAGMITYTETATGSGSLGTHNFTDAMVTITGTGDTANITSPFSGTFELSITTVKVTVAGIGTATFTDSVEVADTQHASIAGFIDITHPRDILGTNNSIFATYDLKTAIGPVSGPADASGVGIDFPTTLGNFVLTSVENDTPLSRRPPPPPNPPR
jgi:hypothetical protein